MESTVKDIVQRAHSKSEELRKNKRLEAQSSKRNLSKDDFNHEISEKEAKTLFNLCKSGKLSVAQLRDLSQALSSKPEFSTTFLMKFTAHTTPINSIVWNTFYPSVFLSCASEYSINIWHKDFPQPLLRYDLGAQVGDIAWSPHSSTVFSAATLDGRVMVFDLFVNKYSAICNQVGCVGSGQARIYIHF